MTSTLTVSQPYPTHVPELLYVKDTALPAPANVVAKMNTKTGFLGRTNHAGPRPSMQAIRAALGLQMATDQEAIKVYLPQREAARLRELAAAEERSITSLVRIILRGYLREHESEAAPEALA